MRYAKSICHWPRDDRPREKLAKYGEQSLNNSELLAILLRTGIKGESAVDLARRILQKFKTFREMSAAGPEFWMNIKGLGPAKIAQIKAALEIGRRFREDEHLQQSFQIKNAEDAVKILMPQMRDLKKEIFKTIYLDGSHRVIQIITEAQGTVNFANPIIREKKKIKKFIVSLLKKIINHG